MNEVDNNQNLNCISWIEPKLSEKLRIKILKSKYFLLKRFIKSTYKSFMIYFIITFLVGLLFSLKIIILFGISLLVGISLSIIIYLSSIIFYWASTIKIEFNNNMIAVRNNNRIVFKYPYLEINHCEIGECIYKNKKYRYLTLYLSEIKHAYFIPDGINLEKIKEILDNKCIKYNISGLNSDNYDSELTNKFKYPIKSRIAILSVLFILSIFIFIDAYEVIFNDMSRNDIIFHILFVILLITFLFLLYLLYQEFKFFIIDHDGIVERLIFKSDIKIPWTSIKEVSIINSNISGEMLQIYTTSNHKKISIKNNIEDFDLLCKYIQEYSNKIIFTPKRTAGGPGD